MPPRRGMLLAYAAMLATSASACSTWTPVRNASDIERGHVVKIERAARTFVFTSVVRCDSTGTNVAHTESDCRSSADTFNTRRDKVYFHEQVGETSGAAFGFFGAVGLGAFLGFMAWFLNQKAI